MAIWLTQKINLKGEGEVDPGVVLKALIKQESQAEFAYFKLINNLEQIIEIWALNYVYAQWIVRMNWNFTNNDVLWLLEMFFIYIICLI